MADQQSTAARAAAARLAGEVLAALDAALQRMARNSNGDGLTWGPRHPGFELNGALVMAKADVRRLIEDSAWLPHEVEPAHAWAVDQVRVGDLHTDDVVQIRDRWCEVRDWWDSEALDDLGDDLGEDHEDIPKIRAIVEGLPYARVALRVVDVDASNEHEIVCDVLGFGANDLLPTQVPAVFHG